MNSQKVINLDEFMVELTAGVKSVDALVAKVTQVLNNSDSPDFVKPGTQCDCSCGLSLRDHLQEIIDIPNWAEQVLAQAKFLERLAEVPEEAPSEDIGYQLRITFIG